MRVAMYYNNHDLRLEELPVPKIGRGEILMRVMAGGICGSDVMEWYRIKTAPRVLGHEVAGEIVEVGDGVRGFKVGDRVVVSHHVPCNRCYYCVNGNESVCDTLRTTNFDPGGFSEYIRIPEINVDRGVFPLPEGLSYDEGTFVEPVACVVRGLRRADFKPAQSILVVGSGISGLLFVKVARALGAGRIMATDINRYRLEAAERFGAEAIFHADDLNDECIREINDGRLADLVAICIGSLDAIEQALGYAERGGTILFFAPSEPGKDVSLPLWDIWRDGITLSTTYAGAPSDIMIAIELLKTRRLEVEDMITHRFSLADTQKGFELVAKAGDSIKVIIHPQE